MIVLKHLFWKWLGWMALQLIRANPGGKNINKLRISVLIFLFNFLGFDWCSSSK
jgi:hypothetical protein